jgi:hypothetical protein
VRCQGVGRDTRPNPHGDEAPPQWGRSHGELIGEMVAFIDSRIRPEMRQLWSDRMGHLPPDRRWIDSRVAEFLRFCAELTDPLDGERPYDT